MNRKIALYAAALAAWPAVPTRPLVYFLGVGPGDPGLVTVAGLQAVQQADVILYDRLAPQDIMDENPSAEKIPVGKVPRGKYVPQEETNLLLVEHAQQGKKVVRLKGGDSFVFGRGGEEAEAARAAGIAVEVVPGVSAANGACAAAQIALTHRDAASIVSFVAGQCKGLAEQDWAGLAGKGRTLVIYMGVAPAAQIAEKLMADGVAPDMPVAVLENGTRPGARGLRTLLADFPSVAAGGQVVSDIVAAGIVPAAVEMMDALAIEAAERRRSGAPIASRGW